MATAVDSHTRLLADAERWFDRARAVLLGQIPCRPGCHRCCIGTFAITILDAAALQRGLAAFEPSVRLDIEARARGQIAAFERAFPQLGASPWVDGWSDPDLDSVAARFTDCPCPALDPDGRCRVYAFRPLTCRMTGVPVEADGIVEGACEVQTAVPLVRLSRALRAEADRFAEREAEVIEAQRRASPGMGEEILLPYGFLPDAVPRRP